MPATTLLWPAMLFFSPSLPIARMAGGITIVDACCRRLSLMCPCQGKGGVVQAPQPSQTQASLKSDGRLWITVLYKIPFHRQAALCRLAFRPVPPCQTGRSGSLSGQFRSLARPLPATACIPAACARRCFRCVSVRFPLHLSPPCPALSALTCASSALDIIMFLYYA